MRWLTGGRLITIPSLEVCCPGGRGAVRTSWNDSVVTAEAWPRTSVACNRILDLVGPVSLPERELVQRAARLLGRTVRVRSIPKAPLRFALAIRRRVSAPGFSHHVVDVITADTRLDSQTAASTLGIQLTGLDEMIKKSLGKT